MFYIFLIWFLVIVLIVSVEVLFLLWKVNRKTLSFDYFPSLSNPQEIQFHLTGTSWLFNISCCLFALLSGYIIEINFKPVARTYQYFQLIYPSFYRKIPADLREIFIALAFISLLNITALSFCLGFSLSVIQSFSILLISSSFGIGLLLPPILRYRTTQLLDRPEKPVQAVIHKMVPQFPLTVSLTIGQIYLKILIPFLSLFLALLIPLSFNLLVLQPIQYVILCLGLFAGLSLAWYCYRTHQLEPALFIRNLKHLSILAGVSSIVLLFGLSSENLVVLSVTTVFSGFIVGTY